MKHKDLTPEMEKMVEHPHVLRVMSNPEKVVMKRDLFIEAMQAVRKEAVGECISIVFSHTDGTTYADMAKEMDELLLPNKKE